MALRTRNILSLCAGVGGLELGILLALHHIGEAGRGICYVEREDAAAASLVASMEAGWLHPAPVWSDMLTFDARAWRGLIHILASGDPCQDNSIAGQRAGAEGERFLAPEVVRIADECRPDLIFRENVPGNADGQLAAIVPPLERLGYCVAAGIFSSSETGNTMRRERLFIMAERESGGRGERGPSGEPGCLGHADSGGEGLGFAPHDHGRRRERAEEEGTGPDGKRRGRSSGASTSLQSNGSGAMAGAGCARPQGRELSGASGSKHRFAAPRSATELRGTLLPPAVIPGPTDSRWIDVLERYPELQPALSQEEAESHLRRGVDALAHRTERLRATGNGVDPVVAAYAFLSLRTRLAEARNAAGQPVLMGDAA